MTTMESRLRQALDADRESYLRPLLELIAIDTQVLGHGIDGGREAQGQLYIENLLRSLGADVRRLPMTEGAVAEAISLWGEGNAGHVYDDRWNVLGRFGGRGGPSLLFNGHVDTMPPGERADWSFDPHGAHVSDGRVWGLGANDMKGGLMAALMAPRLVREAGFTLPGDVTVLSVVDEEGGGNGTLGALMEGVTADGAVVCEPTSLAVTGAHMGFLFFRVDVTGRALHSGSKWLGVNAIEKAMILIEALQDLERRWLMEHRHPLLPPPTINVGVIEGGTAGSTVPDRCTFRLCLHYLPSMERDKVVADVEEALRLRSRGDAWLAENPPRTAIYQEGRPFEMDLSHPFVETVRGCVEAATQRRAVVNGSPAGNDARLLRNIGKMPTVIVGPGPLANCHRPDEWLPLEEYFQSIVAYAMLILEWGGRRK